MKYANLNIEPQNNINTFDIEESLVKGTIFKSLYEKYKVKNEIPNFNNKKENLLFLLMAIDFSIIDMSLYLLNNPNNLEAKNKLNDYLKDYQKLIIFYENNYGPLSINSIVNKMKGDN